MKKLFLQACLLTATVSPVCALVDNTVSYAQNLGQAATNVVADAAVDTANVARAVVGAPPVGKNAYSNRYGYRHSRWSPYHDENRPHGRLRQRIDEHRYVTAKQRVERDKARLVEDNQLARTR